ncbi:MAG TPA: hypothetical protein VN682_02660 [Terriglobales bacterium]|nr:hypothetical protein [Terriglobales bacterium]
MRTRFRFSAGGEPVLPLAQSLIEQELLVAKHLEKANSVVEALQAALTDIVIPAFGDGPDQFSIELGVTDALDEYRKPEKNVVFFVWNNTADPRYIPLRPIYECLNGNPRREGLMASLYLWLYRTASRVFEAFGFIDAQHIYQWRRDAYISEREAGEDVDLESEVECADPAKVVNYIRNSSRLRLKTGDIPEAIASIGDSQVRHAFQKAHEMYRESRSIRLPAMSNECAQLAHDAAYYMESSPLPALGISHWRDDPIVAWFDEFCRDQFESGDTPRAPILLCFHPRDTSFFLKIVKSLPRMARTAASLGEWVRFAEELENASHYSDREDSGLSPETGDTHL